MCAAQWTWGQSGIHETQSQKTLSWHIMLLPNPPSVAYRTPYLSRWYSTLLSLLFKELTSQPNKCDSGPTIKESSTLPCSQPSWSSLHDRKIECPLKTATAGSSLEEWNWVLQKVVYASNQHLVYCTVSPTVRIHRSRNQGVEKAITVLTHYHS